MHYIKDTQKRFQFVDAFYNKLNHLCLHYYYLNYLRKPIIQTKPLSSVEIDLASEQQIKFQCNMTAFRMNSFSAQLLPNPFQRKSKTASQLTSC